MKFNYGLNQLSMPVYDKKLWLSDSFFEPPTIRSVASLVCDIAGSATGQSWWLGILDDALFASLDIVVEDKDVGEVATEFGKAALTNTISVGLGAASNGLSSLAGNISNTAAKVATQAAISASSAYISQVSNSYINALSYSAENGWSMDWDNANNSWFSNDTLAATLGAGISTGISTGLNEFNLGVNNSNVHGFNSNQIDSIKNLNNLAGGLASSGVSFAFTGNATFNILNLTDFGSRINGGLLEFTVGKDGVSSKIGNGGTNISYSTIKSSISGASSLHKNSQINKTGYDKQTKDALRSQWGFGDKTAKKQLEEIIKGDIILKLDADGSEVAQSINENGQKIIHINSSQNEGFIDLGLTLQHEAHRDGIISDEQSQYIETVNAVAGHTKMALAMTKDSLYTKDMLNHISSDTNLQNDINAYLYAAYTGNTGLFAGYVGANYDTSADYWRVHENGSITWDGQLNFYKDGETDKNDAEAGKLLDYRNLDEVIESAKKNGLETVMLGGIEVDVERLKEIAISNEYIIDNSTYKNGKYTSFAAESLLSDGYMSYDEALKSEKDLANKYFWYLKLPDVVEHWSARYVLNQNDELAKTDWANNKYVPDNQSVEEFREKIKEGRITFSENVELLGNGASVYHGKDCLKYLFKNDDSFGSSRESVLGAIHDISGNVTGYNFETRDNYMGTYNYGSGLYHLDLDMRPYWKWGNTPDDLFGSKTQGIEATPKPKRYHPYIQDSVDTYNKFLLEEKNYFESLYFQSINYIY